MGFISTRGRHALHSLRIQNQISFCVSSYHFLSLVHHRLRFFDMFFSFAYSFLAFLFVRVGLALMSGLHCYLGPPPACSCGWNYLVYLACRPSSASVSNGRKGGGGGGEGGGQHIGCAWCGLMDSRQLAMSAGNKSAFLFYSDGSPWKPNAGGEGQGITVDGRLFPWLILYNLLVQFSCMWQHQTAV